MDAPTSARPWFERDDWEAEAVRRALEPRDVRLVDTFRRQGFIVLEDERILDELDVDGMWTRLAGHFAPGSAGRVQDAWTHEPAVRAVATHPSVIAVLRMLYGREPIPFQTLNFLNGTEQRTHSDTIHFSSLPSGFMCGVWMALEDVTFRQGPLHYFPGSQRLPELDYEDVGVPAVVGEPSWRNPNTLASYLLYEERIDAIARESGFQREELAIRRGSFLIWSANLLHGGSPRDDATLTRKSQVTHYYFSDAVPFTPMHSRRSEDAFAVRRVHDIRTGELIVPTLDGVPVVFPVRDEWTRGIKRVHGLAGRLATHAMTLGHGLPRSTRDALNLTVRNSVKKLLHR
jgi:ectoine hydroxylase-related dioxygenase (phytanoyl-CoA dioxygenase family)